MRRARSCFVSERKSGPPDPHGCSPRARQRRRRRHRSACPQRRWESRRSREWTTRCAPGAKHPPAARGARPRLASTARHSCRQVAKWRRPRKRRPRRRRAGPRRLLRRSAATPLRPRDQFRQPPVGHHATPRRGHDGYAARAGNGGSPQPCCWSRWESSSVQRATSALWLPSLASSPGWAGRPEAEASAAPEPAEPPEPARLAEAESRRRRGPSRRDRSGLDLRGPNLRGTLPL